MTTDATDQAVGLSPTGLDQAIDQVLARPEFAWRLPRETGAGTAEDEGGFFAEFIVRLVEWMENALRFIWRFVERIVEWLTDRLGRGETPDPGNWAIRPQLLLFILLVLVASMFAILLLRIAKRRKGRPTAAQPVEPMPDIARDDVVADQLPSEAWMSMARDFLSRGEWRLAVRAMFLAALAHLATRDCLTIALYKSNREYLAELRRRAHDREGLLTAFQANVRSFEEVWYGMHPLTEERLAAFKRHQEALLHDAESQG